MVGFFIRKDFLVLLPQLNPEGTREHKGKTKVSISSMGERFNTLPPNRMEDMLQFLDPLNVELIKSSLGEPLCFDSKEFQHFFKQLIEDCKGILHKKEVFFVLFCLTHNY